MLFYFSFKMATEADAKSTMQNGGNRSRLLPPLKKRNNRSKKLETLYSIESKSSAESVGETPDVMDVSVDVTDEFEQIVSPHPMFENLGPNRRPSMYVAQMKPQLTQLISGLKPVAADDPEMIGQIHAKVLKEVNNLLTDLEVKPEIEEEFEIVPNVEPKVEPEVKVEEVKSELKAEVENELEIEQNSEPFITFAKNQDLLIPNGSRRLLPPLRYVDKSSRKNPSPEFIQLVSNIALAIDRGNFFTFDMQ